MRKIPFAMGAAVLTVTLMAAACGAGSGVTNTTGAATTPKSGGTLHVALLSDVQDAFDPQKEYSSLTWEYFRCCLLRTLLSYTGQTTAEGGGSPEPDLAAADPEVAADGLTWTFKLKPDIHYAPPLQDLTVTSADFVRAFEREANPKANVGGYSFYYSAIRGFDAFATGKANAISGVETPDDATLVIHLTAPTGDLGYRMAMPATAPIPPNPDDPNAPLGIAQGHDADFGRYMVGTGPYMFQGTPDLDFSEPAKAQDAVSGYVPGRSFVFVRNPSWQASSDDLRPAYPDQMQFVIGGTESDLSLQVDSGQLDLMLDGVPPSDQVRRYASDPSLEGQLHADPSDGVRFLEMNLAAPPFDDVHVRKALNYALDKQGMLQLRGGPLFGQIAGHIMVNSLENDLLSDYDPYASQNGAGDIDKAKAEIAQSAYDANHDGVCDASVCNDVLTISDVADPYPKQLALIRQTLSQLGITLNPKALERATMYAKCEDPNSQWALCTAPAWGKDYADGYTFASPLFTRSAIGPDSCCNDTMVGATSSMLKERGYAPVAVPSAEQQVDKCIPLTGDARFQCWADLDKYLMETVVPWVPYLFDNDVVIVSKNVTNYSFDQFAGLPALDHLSVS
jgi:peptide/nickel transport system substrate-binding protein